MEKDNIIDILLETPYWVIDILPKQVPADSSGQYFKIENYYRKEPQIDALCRRFGNILLRLNCYEDISVFHFSSEWTDNPPPETLVQWLAERKPLYVLLKSASAMIAIDGNEHYMTLYNSNEELLELVRALATSEGLFVWKP